MIDSVLVIVGGLCIIAGIVGCLVPILPGPPVSYFGLVLLHLTSEHDFSTRFLFAFAILTLAVMLLDSLIPIYSTKKFHGSNLGIWGCTIGTIAGVIFFPPLGIIIGPVLGAFIGEVISGKGAAQATKAAFGSFIGFLAGIGIKLVLTFTMAYYFLITVL